MRAVVSVIGGDMVGILVKVDAECENANMNVIEMSQTLFQGIFAVIMLTDIIKGNTTLANFTVRIENVGKQGGLTIHVMHGDTFNSTHKIQGGGYIIDVHDILETIKTIGGEYLDVRTVMMGTSLLDCCDSGIGKSCEKAYNKTTRLAKNLVRTGEDIKREYGVPTINRRISATPTAMPVAVSGGDPIEYTHTLERCTQVMGISFIDGYSALVQKGCAAGSRELMEFILRVSAEIEHACAPVNAGLAKAGININAVELVGRMVKEVVRLTKDRNCIGATKLVIFCNVPEDNPFMVGASYGVGGADCVINVGVSGPNVVRTTPAKVDRSLPTNGLADIIKKTTFKAACMGQLVEMLVSERLGISFGIVDLSLVSTPAIKGSVAYILKEMGLESCGVYRMTACLAMLDDAVKRGGVMVSGTIDGLPSTFIPVNEDAGMIATTRAGTLCLEELEAITAIYLVGPDMVVIPSETTPEVVSSVIADEAIIGMVNSKATAVHAVPAIDKKVGEELEFGGLPGSGLMMNTNQTDCSVMMHRKGRIPVPVQTLKS